MMKKTKVFSIILTVLTILFSMGSLALAALAFMHVKEAGDQLAYDDTILVGGIGDHEVESAPYDFPVTDASIRLTVVEGKFYAQTPSFVLSTAETEPIVVAFPDGDYTVQYDQHEGFLSTSIRDCVVAIRCVPAADVVTDAVSRFEDDEDESIIVVAQRRVGENAALSVISDKISDPEQETAVVEFVKSVYETVALHNGSMTITASALTFTDTWSKNILIDSDVLSVSNGEQAVYVAPYTNALDGTGMNEELVLSDTLTVMSGKYHDAETGYAPYICKNDDAVLLIVAGGDEVMRSAFGSIAPTT